MSATRVVSRSSRPGNLPRLFPLTARYVDRPHVFLSDKVVASANQTSLSSLAWDGFWATADCRHDTCIGDWSSSITSREAVSVCTVPLYFDERLHRQTLRLPLPL